MGDTVKVEHHADHQGVARVHGLPDPTDDDEAVPKKWAEDNLGSGGGFDFVNVLGSDVSTTSTSFVDVTGLGHAIGANEDWLVWFEGCWVFSAGTATTIHAELGLNGPASPSAIQGSVWQGSYSANIQQHYGFSGWDESPSGLIYGPHTLSKPVTLWAYIGNGANSGTVIPRFLSESGSHTLTIEAGSRFYGVQVS
jgi:hypothetical protein